MNRQIAPPADCRVVSGMWVRQDGVCRGRANLERDGAMLALHASGICGDLLRFHRYAPAALVGRHQAIAREIRTEFCAAEGVDVLRRPSGGGALYLDPGTQCFSLLVPSGVLGATAGARLETGVRMVAAGLSRFGLSPSFKAPNDLELNGRKIASVFLAEQGASALVMAVIPVALDVATAMKTLLVPTEKLTVSGLERARERVTSLRDVLGSVPDERALCDGLGQGVAEVLGAAFAPAAVVGCQCDPVGKIPDQQDDWPQRAGSDGTVETLHKHGGTTLRLRLKLRGEIVDAAWLATDAHLQPADLPDRLCRALVGVAVPRLAEACRTWLDGQLVDAAGIDGTAIARLVALSAEKIRLNRQLGLTAPQLSGLMLSGDATDASQTLRRAAVMLVPYCAKPAWCKFRHTTECSECGRCEVGKAYRLARQRAMTVVTITNFEHLTETFGRMRQAGVTAYVGMCCGHFFQKRHRAFADCGMDGVLLDIVGSTCYELNQEHLAYAGKFAAEARLDADAVARMMQVVPGKPGPDAS